MLPRNSRLNVGHSPKTKREKAEMRKIPYASVVNSLMYAIVCTRMDIVYVVETAKHYMSDLGKEHWVVVKYLPKIRLYKPVLEGFYRL